MEIDSVEEVPALLAAEAMVKGTIHVIGFAKGRLEQAVTTCCPPPTLTWRSAESEHIRAGRGKRGSDTLAWEVGAVVAGSYCSVRDQG